MGIDIYVGSLSRYYQGHWRTSVQQYGLDHNITVNIIRPGASETKDAPLEPSDVSRVIATWQKSLADSLGVTALWDDDADSPYATNKPGWKGLGGVNLLAAYAVRPDFDPSKMKKRFGRKPALDNARNYDESAAFQATRDNFGDFPSLLGQTIWWLPVETAPTLFAANRPDGGTQTMSNLTQLIKELNQLAAIHGITDERAEELRLAGPGSADDPYRNGLFGIAALLPMADWALLNNKPLLVDY